MALEATVAVLVIGKVLGYENSSGTLDNGRPWQARDCVLLTGLETTKVKLDKIQGPFEEPDRDTYVAFEVNPRGRASGAVRYEATRRAVEVEQALELAGA